MSAGIDQTTTSMRPENSQSGRWIAFSLPARNHQAKTSVSTITGTITASMIVVAVEQNVRSAAAYRALRIEHPGLPWPRGLHDVPLSNAKTDEEIGANIRLTRA